MPTTRTLPMHSSIVVTLDITWRREMVNHRLLSTVHRILSNIIMADNSGYSRHRLLYQANSNPNTAPLVTCSRSKNSSRHPNKVVGEAMDISGASRLSHTLRTLKSGGRNYST